MSRVSEGLVLLRCALGCETFKFNLRTIITTFGSEQAKNNSQDGYLFGLPSPKSHSVVFSVLWYFFLPEFLVALRPLRNASRWFKTA